ncbi:MAG TPA: hypothetical protein VGH27_08870 [Streptosporangiaceae bacterium]|jgi:hypothetical protein
MRRLFWVSVGAGLGISGYRRATRVVREISRPRSLRPRWKVTGVAAFARDVRDGMDLYAEQQRLNIERRRAPAAVHASENPASRNGSSAPSAHR